MTSSLKRPAHRPRTEVDEDAIKRGHARGASITALAQLHDVSRDIIRRVLNDEPEPDRKARVVMFPSTYSPVAPAGHVTSAQLFEATPMSLRQLDYWCRTGLLRVHGYADPGSGHARFYPKTEIPVVHLVCQLLTADLPPRAAFRIARELLETGTSSVAGIRLDLPQEW